MYYRYAGEAGATTMPAFGHPRPALLIVELNMSELKIAESFRAMLRRVLGHRLRPGAETFPDMFAEDGVLNTRSRRPG